jgi:hypothetical protein
MKNLCTARRTNGQPCRNAPINGATVCRVHGGSAPQVKRKAAERLAEARDAALTKLLGMIEAGQIDARVALDAVVKLTEQVETLEGRVARREGHVVDERSHLDAEIEQLLANFPADRNRPGSVRPAHVTEPLD